MRLLTLDDKKMNKEFQIREEDKERIIDDFRSIKFRCIRCGLQNIQVIGAEPCADGINVHGSHESADPKKDIEMTFYITGLLFCKRCNHRFHVKILDQGTRNTDVYFDNMLT